MGVVDVGLCDVALELVIGWVNALQKALYDGYTTIWLRAVYVM